MLGPEDIIVGDKGLAVTLSLNLFGAAGLVVAQVARAVGGDEVVLFVADATEVFPRIELVVADEVGKLILGTPLVDELGDKVDTGLNGEDEAWLEFAGQAQ